MTPQERRRETVLERELAGLAAYEQRVLANLRLVGFRFESVSAARRRLLAVRRVARMTPQQLREVALVAMEKGVGR